MTTPLILVKLGGSLITDKTRPRTVNVDRLRQLARDLAAALEQNPTPIILGHGSGSFGHDAAKRWPLTPGLPLRERLLNAARIHLAARELHVDVLRALVEAGLPAFSQPPASVLVTERGQVAAAPGKSRTLRRALELGLLPVVMGDVALDSEDGVGVVSTESVFQAVTHNLDSWTIARIIWLGDTPGVLDAAGKTIPVLTPSSFEQHHEHIKGSAATDVTGGMLHRVETAIWFATRGIPSLIADGTTDGALERALLTPAGDAGTTLVTPDGREAG